jgi:hypothetical protein
MSCHKSTLEVGISRKSRRAAIRTVARYAVSAAAFLVAAACGSKHGGTLDGGGGGDASATEAGDATFADGGHADTGMAMDGGDGGNAADAAEDACMTPDGGPYVALTWNEGCGQTVTTFLVEWGQMDGGPYPNVADAGDPCDGAACVEGGASAQLFCHYNLRGLDAGNWCIVTEACDNGACSTPSGQACVTIPEPCP